MNHHQTSLTASLLLIFYLGFGWSVELPAASPVEPLPEVPWVYTELMPSILVRGVDLESLPDGTIQPEYVNPSDLPFTITMTGLPPGLRVADGVIVGTPTKKGIYRASIRVGNAYGRSPAAIWVVQVVDEPQADFGPGGSFFGVSPVNQSSKFPFDLRISRLQVEVTPAGAFSGSLSILGDRRRFTGQLSMNPEDSMERLSVISFTTRVGRVSGVRLTLTQTAKPGFVRWFRARVETDDGSNDEVQLYPRLQPTDAEQKMLRGRQNLHLEDQVYHGIASLYCSPGMEATLIGVLPDGSGFTTSSPLLRIETATPGFLVGHDDGKYGNLIGQIQIYGWPESARTQVGGVLSWHIVPRPGSRAMFEGIDVNFQVVGGTYVPPRPGALLLSSAPKTPGNALLLITGGAFVEQTFTLTSAHRAVFPAGAENPFRARLDFYAPTGFFTGKFQVEDVIPGPVSRKLTRWVNFRGLIIMQAPDVGSMGRGFFIMASPPDPTTTPPTTLANSMLLPGGIQLLELNH